MARFCIQHLDVDVRQPDVAFDSEYPPDIDALWVESVLGFQAESGAGDSDGDLARMACVVLNLTRNMRVFEALSEAGKRLRGVLVRRELFAGLTAAEDFGAPLHERRVDFLHVVVLAGDMGRSTELANATAELLAAAFPDAMGVRLVVVNPGGSDRPALHDFGVVEVPDVAGSCPSLLWALSTLLAPHLMTCLDAEDVEQGVGTVAAPSGVIKAAWHPESGTLAFESQDGRAGCASSQSAVAFLFIGSGDPRLQGALSALRAAAPVCESLSYQVAIDHLQPAPGQFPVVILVRP